MQPKLDEFTLSYIETALWSSTDNLCRCADGKIAELERHKDRLEGYGKDRMPLSMGNELDQVKAELATLEHEWCGRETGGEPLDSNYSIDDIDAATLKQMILDCNDFQTSNWELIKDLDLGRVGHDFWLTRNRHGAGFWDGDYEEKLGKELTKIAQAYGEYNLYVTDDNFISGT